MPLTLRHKSACPVDLVKEYICKYAFGRFGKVACDEEPIDGNIGEICEDHYNGKDYRPHKYAVKKERDAHSSAATECEISRVGVSDKGQGDSRDYDHICRQRADAFRCLVHHGEKGREAGKQESENRCAGNRKGDHLAVGVLCLFDLARAQLVAYDNGNGVSEGHIKDREKIDDGEIYMKGIDHSYFYEGYATFKTKDL